MSLTMTLGWRVRDALGPDGRRRARRVADATLRPIGSVRSFARADGRFALTFDDGPDPVWTPPLLELLAQRSASATFFLLTDRARRHPGLVGRIRDGGHEVALHGDEHSRMTMAPARQVCRRLRIAKSELEQTAQVRVRLFRPPFGAQSLGSYAAARRAGLDVVVWGPFARDWVDGTPQEVADRALGSVRGGDILLLHDGLEIPDGQPRPTFDRTEMVRLLLEGLASDGLLPDTVGCLIRQAGTMRSAWFRP